MPPRRGGIIVDLAETSPAKSPASLLDEFLGECAAINPQYLAGQMANAIPNGAGVQNMKLPAPFGECAILQVTLLFHIFEL